MPAEGDHCYNLVTTTAEEALAVVGLKPVAMPQLKAPFEPVQCAQFERLVAQERNRHIGEFKPAFVRAAGIDPRLQHTFMPAGDASLTTAQVNQKIH